ncbi:hypothetical protein JAAARDRAFT_211778 [Jaapia argillacea MUCL 33604]|uniref:Phosphoglycerate mutase-like protein n=1 Tax=Jaapia argillacea MUCL 33604 TaxID=933084 RepID=A0A067P6G0_9AGAM|nr:hypothetical protein JAAARDRAFT_211778 [Jaapia argillacea MUCL 33604]
MSSDSVVLGVVLIARHGDRQGFYQDPLTYTASATAITPLGNQQEYQLGQYIRALYLNESSPSYIQGVTADLFNQNQVEVRADAGGEGGVIFDSAVSLLQGLWPATTEYNTTLANGSTITGPLGGYQYVPIAAVDPNLDVSLEGWTDCNTFNNATNAFYSSPGFQQVAAQSASFLNELAQYVDGRAVTLENMWNIFDYLNVNSIHNATFYNALPPTFLAQARALANYHEYGVFTSPQMTGIGNIAGQAMLPSILTGLENIANSSNPLKFTYEAIAYKPFLSLFNMTGVAATYPELATIVEYAAALAYEVRQPINGGDLTVRMNFKNGTNADFVTYGLLGTTGDVPLSEFISTMSPAAINTTEEWCNVCANTVDRGCAAYYTTMPMTSATTHQKISPVGAGFLGAGLTLAVALATIGVLAYFGFATFGPKARKAKVGLARQASEGDSVGEVKA